MSFMMKMKVWRGREERVGCNRQTKRQVPGIQCMYCTCMYVYIWNSSKS